MTVTELNALSDADFVTAVGWVFEHSPWVAERAASSRPFQTLDQLHTLLTAIVAGAGRDAQLALLRAHPDLGARARMSDASHGEQSGAGLDALSRTEFKRLQALNRAYHEKFGFPFLYAVAGSRAPHIIEALTARLPRSWDDEFAEALRQVSRIARVRLDRLMATHTPTT